MWRLTFRLVFVVLVACASAPPTDREAVAIQQPYPAYPHQLADLNIEGYVVVSYTIDTEGSVRDATVLESSPEDEFRQAALHAVPKWRFHPKREAGRNVEDERKATFFFCLPGPLPTGRPHFEPCRGPRNKNHFLEQVEARVGD